jgi:hypothetical protein
MLYSFITNTPKPAAPMLKGVKSMIEAVVSGEGRNPIKAPAITNPTVNKAINKPIQSKENFSLDARLVI